MSAPEEDPGGAVARDPVVLEHAVSAAGVATFVWDLRSGLLHADERLLRLYALDGPLERPVEDFFARIHPDDVARVRALVDEALARRSTYDAEYRLVLPAGRTRWIAARGRVVSDAGGPARMIGAAHDTTAHREADARVASVMDSLATAFFALDRSWRFSFLNKEAERVLGRRREELLGGVVWEQFPLAVGSDFETNYRHAMENGESVAFDAYYPEPLNAWYEVRALPHPGGLAVHFLDITERRRAEEHANRAIARARVLGQVTAELSATLDPQEAIDALARLVVPSLCDWAVVTLIDDGRQAGTRAGLSASGAWHRDPERRADTARYAAVRLGEMADDSVVVRAVEAGEEQVIERDALAVLDDMLPPGEARTLFSALAPDAIAVLPLMGREDPIGMLSLCNGAARGPFPTEDLELARDIAGRAGIALDRARLYRRQQQVAEGLQRSLFTEPPHSGELEIAVRYVPAAEAHQVGGDWYDAFVQESGATVLVIGDVMGHDLLAAAAMGQMRSVVRAVAALTGDAPAAVLRDVERVMRTLRLTTTATAVLARLDPLGGGSPAYRLRWANAGHPPPVLLTAGGGVRVLDDGPAGLLLGVLPDTLRRESVALLEPGDTLVLYTDGLVERRSQNLEQGLARLSATLAAHGDGEVDKLCDALLGELVPDRPEDDVALIALRVRPAGAPPA